MIYCINIDWLELYCLENSSVYPCTSDYFENLGYNVRIREYGTRVYGEMFTILDSAGYPFIEIRRRPLSDKAKDGGLFDERSTHIRLSNYYCYHPDAIDLVREFLLRHKYYLVRIFRIDIACDFEKFVQGDDPNKFIQRYIAGRYSKVNQTNINAHGVDNWNGRQWNSLSWGKPKSMIGTKMYCKTLELQQVKDKPYIRQTWWNASLVDNPITMTRTDEQGNRYTPMIWRVEFSIHSSAKKWYLIEDSDTRKEKKIPMPHTLDIYDSKDKLQCVFASLARHYFRFKYYEVDKRKDRCRDKVLFDFRYLRQYLKVERLASNTPAKKEQERLIRMLEHYRESTTDPKNKTAATTIIDALKRIQATEFAGHNMTVEDILELQLMMQNNGKEMTIAEKEQERKQIRDLIATFGKSLF